MSDLSLGDRLDGYKTYLAALGFLMLAAYKCWTRRWEDGIEMALVAFATASLRHAIARKKVIVAREDHFLEDHD
ncbi:hypothetical protein TA3x_004068 [Tundrisphaera sp. TA3]|uniref:hypothetical protein n=1 Tax=Tundrisphaera sp. TA3 TaxID=3435775 RepID=UPI003EB85AA2